MNEQQKQNRSYWNQQASSDAMWHISHSKSEAEFRESGERDAKKAFGLELERVPMRGKVLEIGCGIGRVLEHVSGARPEVAFFGVDVAPEMVRQANERLAERRNVVILRTSGDTLDMFDDGYFKCVYSLMVFQHLPTSIFRSYAKDVARVLSSNGVFRFQVQYWDAKNGQDPYAASDFRSIRYYDVGALRNVLPGELHIVDYPAKVLSGKAHDYYVSATRA
jgi:SAM-dependent methyltransferase